MKKVMTTMVTFAAVATQANAFVATDGEVLGASTGVLSQTGTNVFAIAAVAAVVAITSGFYLLRNEKATK